MAKNCVTEKTARRQEWIENGLLDLMLRQRFETITVTDLCRHLSLSRRSFYRYFRDLEDVLDSLLNRTFQRMGILPQLPSPLVLQRNFEFWMENRNVLDALHRSGMLEKLHEYTLRMTQPMSILPYLASDTLDMDISREAGLFAASGSVALAIAWYLDGFRKTPEQMARIAYRLLFSPILEKSQNDRL